MGDLKVFHDPFVCTHEFLDWKNDLNSFTAWKEFNPMKTGLRILQGLDHAFQIHHLFPVNLFDHNVS